MPAPSSNTAYPTPVQALSADLVSPLLAGDWHGALELLQQDGAVDYSTSAVAIIQPALYRVGELWQQRRIGVAEEHIASAVAERLLSWLFTQAKALPDNGKRALFACVPGNHHHLGLRIVADSYALRGWQTDFLGADTPVDSLVEQVIARRPTLVALSVSMESQRPALEAAVAALRDRLGNEVPQIIVGGLWPNQLASPCHITGVDACFPGPAAALESSV